MSDCHTPDPQRMKCLIPSPFFQSLLSFSLFSYVLSDIQTLLLSVDMTWSLSPLILLHHDRAWPLSECHRVWVGPPPQRIFSFARALCLMLCRWLPQEISKGDRQGISDAVAVAVSSSLPVRCVRKEQLVVGEWFYGCRPT